VNAHERCVCPLLRDAMSLALEWAADYARDNAPFKGVPDDLRAAAKRLREGDE
jgi:hypothetical protein